MQCSLPQYFSSHGSPKEGGRVRASWRNLGASPGGVTPEGIRKSTSAFGESGEGRCEGTQAGEAGLRMVYVGDSEKKV